MSVNMVALMTLGGGMFLLAVALHRRTARHLA
jgi:hypothetical protein